MLQKVMGLLRVVVTPMTLMVFSNAFSQETWETYNSTNSGFKGNRVQGIAIDSQGSKWFGTQTAGVNVFDGSAWVNYTTDDGLANDNVYVVTIDSDGNKWLGTNGGVSLFDGSSWASYTAPTIAHNKVNSVAIDSEKNVWLATKEGVSKFDGQSWVNFGSDVLGSDYEYAQAVVVDLDGKIWFGTTGGILMYDGASWVLYGVPEGIPEGNIAISSNAAAVDWDGSLWFGTESGGALKYDGTNWTRYYDDTSGLKNLRVRAIAVDATSHVIWFGHLISGDIEGGVSKYDYDTDSWTTYEATEGGLANSQARAIAVESNGDVWFGTEAGVSVLRGSTGIDSDRPSIVSDFELHQNYPNPFNPETVIRYELLKACMVSLRIYDVSGRLVKTLLNDELQQMGTQTVKWDGVNRFGEKVTSGVYFYSIKSGDFEHTKRMVLVR